MVEHPVIDGWDPRQYDKFQREREQPFYDLLGLVRPAPRMRVVDLGCGTGRLTHVAHQRLQALETIGIDRSDSMLTEIRASVLPPGLRFEIGTIEGFVAQAVGTPTSAGARDVPPSHAASADGRSLGGGSQPAERYDLILSNAAFHWVENHDALLHGLAAALAPSGQLAFQVPAQHDELSHRVADELTEVEPFRTAFGGWRRPQPVLTPDAYARLLYRCGFADPNVRLIVYPHVLTSRDEVVEWMKGTLLTEFERRLPPGSDLFTQFVEEYRSRLTGGLDASQPFFFPFKRILCWGQKSA
jgi:trans-aconitate 2-methyltransferase